LGTTVTNQYLIQDYDRNGSAAKKKKKISGCKPQGAWRQKEVIGGKPLVVK
jgi:hypothetical protein